MKKIILFTFICIATSSFYPISIKCNAQNHHPLCPTNNNPTIVPGTSSRPESFSHFNKPASPQYPTNINTPNAKAKSLVALYDSIYNWKWDTLTHGWKANAYEKTINIIYDAQNNKTSSLIQRWNDTIWVNKRLMNESYDVNNNLTNYLSKTWNGTIWVNTDQEIYRYDASNNETRETDQSWNGTTWDSTSQYNYTYDALKNLITETDLNWNGTGWDNATQFIYTYDAQNNQTSATNKSWSGTTWDNSWHIIYTYDAQNNKINELEQIWDGIAWNNTWQYNYTYDINNNRTSEIYQGWNDTVWTNSYKYTFTYDGNSNMISTLKQDWDGTAWNNSVLNTYTYDGDNNEIIALSQKWVGAVWINYWIYNFGYDGNHFEESFSYKHWNSDATTIISGDSTYYYFHTNVGINDFATQSKDILVYPNPATNNITIVTDAVSKDETISIYNLQGQMILHQPLQQTLTVVNVTNLEQGIYFIKLSDKERATVKKFIKQ